MLQCIFRLCVRVLKLGYNGVQRVGGVFGVVFGGLVNFFVVVLVVAARVFFCFLGDVFWSLFWTVPYIFSSPSFTSTKSPHEGSCFCCSVTSVVVVVLVVVFLVFILSLSACLFLSVSHSLSVSFTR